MARYQLEAEAPETGLHALGRNFSRGVSRAAEVLVGGTGSLLQTVGNIGSLGEQYLENNSPELLKGTLPKPFSQLKEVSSLLPTIQGLKERSPEQPTGEYEQLFDNVISNFVEYANPFLGPLSVGAKSAALASGVGNLAEFATKKLGGGEGAQTAAKVGSVIATTLLGTPKTEAYKNSLYDAARAALPEDASVSAKLLKEPLKKIERTIGLGHESEAEKQALKFLETVSERINPVTGEIPLESVWALKKNINDMAYSSSATAPVKAVQKYLRPLQEALIGTLKQSESKYPEFAKNLFAADEIHRAMNTSGAIGSFLRDHVKLGSIKNPSTLLLLGGAHAAGFPGVPVGLGALAAKPLYLAGEALLKSPEIRKHYLNTVSSALKKNASSTLKNMRLLDKAISKEETPQKRYVLD